MRWAALATALILSSTARAAGPRDVGPEGISFLIKDLGSEEVLVRRRAALELSTLGKAAAPAVGALAKALSDPAVACLAARALAAVGPAAETAVKPLLEAMKAGRLPVGDAARALGKIGPAAREAVPPLVERLDGAQPQVAAEILTALGEIGGPEASRALRNTLGAVKNADLRQVAASMLGIARPVEEASVAALLEALAEADEDLADAAVWALGLMGPDARPALASLETALSSPRVTRRWAAAVALGRMGKAAEPALDGLRKAARRPQPDEEEGPLYRAPHARLAAAWAMYRITGQAEETLGLVTAEIEDQEAAGSPAAIEAVLVLGRMRADAKPALELLARLRETSTIRLKHARPGYPRSTRAAATQALRQVREALDVGDETPAEP